MRLFYDIIPIENPKAKKIAFSSLFVFAALALLELGIFIFSGSHKSFAAGNTVIIVTSTISTTWTVPSDWNNASNTIEVIGGGGGGDAGTSVSPGDGGGGGGGGAYAKAANISLTPGAVVDIKIGTGGGAATAGGDTYLCNASSNCASITGAAVVAGGKGGSGGSGTANGLGGTAASSTGSVKANGGDGAAGTAGAGNNGGNGGGAGGAGGCGAAACAAGSLGAAGNTASGQVGGQGDGTFGGGGGGADTIGNAGLEWNSIYGSGGGGGGGTGGGNRANGNPGQTGGLYGSGGGGGGGEGKNGASGAAGATGVQGIIVITYTPFVPTVTVSSAGSQIATTSIPSLGFYVGGAFTFIRDSATGTVSQIVVTETGTLNANTNLSNLILYYNQQPVCATSSIPGGATQFNGTGVSFNGSEQATVTGSMPVGTSPVCLYAKVDVGSGAGSGQTFDLEIANPSTDVTVDAGNVSPSTAIAISGATTLPTATLTEQDFRMYANADAVSPASPFAAEDASTTNIVSGEVVRIRANITIGGASLVTSTQAFKLQYAPQGGAGTCGAVPNIDFSDVGAFGSSTPWRGYNNPNTADGTTATSTLLASSTVPESYVEENPSPLNPNTITVSGAGEWDFAVEDNAASSGVAYCFRMVTSAGSVLDGYSHYPALSTYAAATWRAPEDTATSTKKDFNLRLRIEISNNGNANDAGSFQLEYATSTAGPWSAVPRDVSCSTTSAAFRICPSGYFLDLDPTENELTAAASTFISGFMISSSTPAPSLALNVGQFTELEWNLQATDAAVDGQTYYFRATDAGTSIGTYSVYPQLSITAASSTFTQNYYRWYVNADVVKPTDPWPPGATDLGENTAITADDSPPKSGDAVRLRMAVSIGNATLATSSQAFKLQYGVRSTSCGAIGSWSDVGALASTTVWRGFNNTSTADGTALSGDPPTAGDLVLSVSDRAGRYTEANPSGVNPYKAAIGDNVEYDWVLQDNNATSSASYCFRMEKSDGTPLDGYTYYPTLTTSGFNPKTQNWQFFDDYNNETPTSPLAAENTSPSNTQDQSIMKLRTTVKELNGVAGQNVKFKLQFSDHSDFSQNVSDVAETLSCTSASLWCYADGAGTDNGVITTKVLSDSDSCASGAGAGCGTHNESGVSSSTFTQSANAATEYEFTIKQSGAAYNVAYFFRLINTATGLAVPLNTGATSPSLVTGGTNFIFTVAGLPSATSTAGVVTTVSSTAASVPFGSLIFSTSTIGGQELTITTNAGGGYEVYAFEDQDLIDSQGSVIPAVSSTNAAPGTWGIASGTTGAFGYHTTDATLSGGSTRFAANDSYAKFETAAREVAYDPAPAASDTVDLVFRVEATNLQPAGSYGDSVSYVAVPVF